jgi:asparagine synthase (glutamine-hydrolysing)
MCGIVGIASVQPVDDGAWLVRGRDAMRHRGPDDAGEWWSSDRRVAFGQRRLAIIDLTPAGHQPMHSHDGSLTIVLNGEIYNFRDLRRDLEAKGASFRSQSDTEVVLAAYREWGTGCLQRLNSMFALAIYDAPNRRLFLARDRAGEKPLYYLRTADSLRFGSELKALLADPALARRVDEDALDCYLTMGYVPGDRCIVRDIKKLPAGHSAIFDLASGRLEIARYWRAPLPIGEQRGVDEDALVAELEELLADSVRRQLVADVPVGILLSGGVDSSLVTAMAVRAAPKVKTFTMRFQGHGRYDETKHARLVARHFGTEHIELDAGGVSVELLQKLARQFDEPIADSSMIPTYLVSRLTREHCTVALGGDGGDELFGGYRHYSRLLRFSRTCGRVPRVLRAPLAAAARALLPVGFKGRNWLQGLSADFAAGLPWVATHFDTSARRDLIARDLWQLVGERVRERTMVATPDLLVRATLDDLEHYLVDDILAKVDRASMLSSLEVRAPLLDYRIIEFAFSKVPSWLKATAVDNKILLKRLVARMLPPEFDVRRKQGFSVPIDSWLAGGAWLRFFREVLLDGDTVFFRRKALEQLHAGQAKGRANGERLFTLVLFELWRREYRAVL